VILLCYEENADSSHSSKEKREKLSKRTKNTQLEIFSPRHFAKKKWVCEILQSSVLTTKSQKRGEKTQKFSFLSSLFIIHRFVFFLSFFLCGHETRILSSFRARKNRKREIERGV
jgi:hypothetical protein